MRTITMVEHVDDYGQWCWYSLYAKTTPRKALIHYAKEMNFDPKEYKIHKEQETLYLGEDVRAYNVTIQSI